jgi:hypothetical protein
MPCTKDELVAAINSYAAARTTGDAPLIQLAAAKLVELLDTVSFAEPEPIQDEEDGGQE